MHIIVRRDKRTKKSTTSRVFVDGNFECYFLEDRVRERMYDRKWIWAARFKVPKETAIPSGTYKVVVDKSQRFQKETPRILDVPDFTGIRIHPGNKAEDTEGCPLPGANRTLNWVSSSRKAYGPLFEKIKDAIARGEKVTIQFANKFDPGGQHALELKHIDETG